MKPAQVNKLYSKLTPQEQAALVFEAAARLDNNDVDAILENVERKTYLAVHADYSQRAYGLTWLAGQYGIEFWKIRALMCVSYFQAENGNPEAEQATKIFLAKIVALEVALAEICKQLKVDVVAVKKIAGCPNSDLQQFELQPVDAELVRQYAEIYTMAGK